MSQHVLKELVRASEKTAGMLRAESSCSNSTNVVETHTSDSIPPWLYRLACHGTGILCALETMQEFQGDESDTNKNICCFFVNIFYQLLP